MSAARPPARRAVIAAALLVCAATLALAGCTGVSEGREGASSDVPVVRSSPADAPPGQADASPTLVPTAEVAFPRPLQAERIVEVLVEAQGEGTVFVTGVELTSPYFEAGPPSDTMVRVSEGWPGHARVPLTRAVCPVGEGSSSALVVLADAHGEPAGEVLVAVEDQVLAEINATECLQRDALDAAQPAFGSLAGVDSTQAQATLVFTRGVSDAAVTIVGVKGNVIFSLDAVAGALPMPMAAELESVEVPVTVRASRCDPHAFAESKKTFVFVAWIEVDGREQYVEFQPDAAWRATLQGLFDACGDQDRG
ncbi:hypothetical protein LGT39_08455 [Demequina sp. TTPB684]|uniref:hypothetical protein n=1 Tax=unclassified Demequina TaxID=2620311 RepID=UPI001CF5D8AE|nr:MULTISPECIES: hypothetical protein [unclassified Demequina]MCB2412876.1 hypothetical protein [Demequina sp. TTPB684]UPU88147.1 hypothetical protein LGT36_013005 [Demequina sp. TMPB413]